MTVLLRDAVEADLPAILRFTRALAAHEGRPEAVSAGLDDLRSAGFGDPRRVWFLVAEAAGEPVGFAAWSTPFSMYRGKGVLSVNTVFVEPAWQGRGLGRRIFAALAVRALAEGLDRMEWSVLGTNRSAIAFYDRLGAGAPPVTSRRYLEGAALRALAA